MNWKYVLAIVLALVSVSAFAVLSSTDGSDAGTGTSGVTYDLNKDTGVLTISGTGAMDDYYLERAPWYDDRYSVRSIVIEDGVTSVGYAAFFACESAVSVSIADSVTVIEGSAFSGCFSITDIIIPDKVESLGDDVFDGCSSLREVYLGSSVSYLGWDVFEGCGSLESVTVSDSNAVYSSDDGVLLGENDTLLMLYPRSKDNVSYTIPSTVRTIENIAFYGNR